MIAAIWKMMRRLLLLLEFWDQRLNAASMLYKGGSETNVKKINLHLYYE